MKWHDIVGLKSRWIVNSNYISKIIAIHRLSGSYNLRGPFGIGSVRCTYVIEGVIRDAWKAG